MSGYDVLARGRTLAEEASNVSLRALVDHLLLLGRVAEGEYQLARCIVVTAPVRGCDLGVIHVPWSRVKDALSMSPTGWVVGRVASGAGIVAAVPGDCELARERVRAVGLDWLKSS